MAGAGGRCDCCRCGCQSRPGCDAAKVPDGGAIVEEHDLDLDGVLKAVDKRVSGGDGVGATVIRVISSATVDLCESVAGPTIITTGVMARPVYRFGVDSTRTLASRNPGRALGPGPR